MKKVILYLTLISLFVHNSFSQNYIPSIDDPIIQGNKMTFALQGYSFMGKNINGDDIDYPIASDATVSCTCNNTSGNCSPFVIKGGGGSTSGCAGSCTDCTKKSSVMLTGGGVELEVISGGFYIQNSETIILNPSEDNTVPAVFDALLRSEKFINEYNTFTQKYFVTSPIVEPIANADGSLDAPQGYSFYCLSIFGRAVLALLPNTSELTGLAYSSKASCSCTQGTCTIKSKTIPFVGSATWCEGNCSGTCTLSTLANPGNKLIIQTYE